MEGIKVGDIFVQDAGDGNFFIRGILSTDELGYHKSWTLHITGDEVYSLNVREPFGLTGVWPSQKYVAGEVIPPTVIVEAEPIFASKEPEVIF